LGWGQQYGSSEGVFNGNITNYNAVQSTGSGSDATALLIESGTFSGDVTNYGNVSGNRSGIVIQPNAFYGNVTNTGYIYGNNGGGLIISSDLIDGSEGEGAAEIVNNNLIHGRMTGLGIYGTDVYANVTNERQDNLYSPLAIIEGTSGVGVAIEAENWTGDITNSGTFIGQASYGGEYAGSSGVGLYVNTYVRREHYEQRLDPGRRGGRRGLYFVKLLLLRVRV
jgi:hypothetical protein